MTNTTKQTFSVVQTAPYQTGTMEHVLASGLGRRKAENMAARFAAQAAETSLSTYSVRAE